MIKIELKIGLIIIDCGTILADEKYFDDSRTMFDPAGHPFCLDTHQE